MTEFADNHDPAPENKQQKPLLDDQPPPVRIHPPLLLLIVAVLAMIAEWLLPSDVVMAALPRIPVAIIGSVITGIGLWCVINAVVIMRAARTNIPTFKPALAVVREGVFARNPIYLGVVLSLFGLALILPSGWLLLLAPLTGLILHGFVIKPEEAYMAARFGADYQDYANQTPRWM